MNHDQIIYNVKFKYSNQQTHTTLNSLKEATINFLQYYGHRNIVGKKFAGIIGKEDGITKFSRLLKASGYENDENGFFTELIRKLEIRNYQNKESFKIKQVTLPYLFLLSILEVLMPGNKLITVKNTKQFQKLANVNVPNFDSDKIQEIIEMYPVRFSLHTIRQMRLSKHIAYQYAPFKSELDGEGLTHTWVGQFHRGIIEQMYQNRVIFILNMSCPVYCRFCFRKHKECRNQKAPTVSHIKEAIAYIKEATDVKEIVLTGGDPFMNRATLTNSIDGLKKISHVQTLRIATRSISYYPHLFFNIDSFWLNYLKMKNLELRQLGKRIEIATHFIHPDEISLDSLEIISELVKNGIPVYVQTPFFFNFNDKGEVLRELYSKLRGAGAEIHYVYIPCSPIKGNSAYWAPLSKGLECAQYLRAYLSDRAMPKMCTATSIGKIDWNSSGWAVKADEDDPRYIWIRTPYNLEYFEKFAPILQISNFAKVNAEGTIDIKFMADIGDENLFAGERNTHLTNVDETFKKEKTQKVTQNFLANLTQFNINNQKLSRSIVSTGSNSISRVHRTRVEIDVMAQENELKNAFSYIQKHEEITDVIIVGQGDITTLIYKVARIIKKLHNISHINAIRIRSLQFNYAPEKYTKTIIKQLKELNQLNIVNSKRLEIETQFLHSSEFKPIHSKLNETLARNGITVYNNTPLLAFINDNDEEMLNISFKCREYGLEFHHLYIAGLHIQDYWSEHYNIDIFDITNIASILRRFGSGREVPRYIIKTILGEVDFGLIKHLFYLKDDTVYINLLPYNLEYYKKLDNNFVLPANAIVEQEIISVPVQGVSLTAKVAV